MSFPGFDAPAIARALALVVGDADEPTEIYCERRIDLELPPEGAPTGLRERREEGLAARLVRGERTWIASRDGLSGRDLAEALRQVARAWPAAPPVPEFELGPSGIEPPRGEMLAFGRRLEGALRRRFAAFPLRLTVRWHRRDVQVVGPRMVPPAEREAFFSLDVELHWGRCGALALALDEREAEALAARLVARFRCREAAPPAVGAPPLLLAPAAAAVALHEAVAHALESDVLALGGNPAAAIGLALGAPGLDVLDDPAGAPAGVDRTSDDEGVPVARRWLLRGGRVEQPIADARAARRWPELLAGSGFRAGRHSRLLPRTHHLELLPGRAGEAELLAAAEGGLAVGEIDSGRLDPATGRFVLEVPGGRRITGGAPGAPVGRFRISGQVAQLLGGVVAVGDAPEAGGAGWCAKGAERRAVWARSPSFVATGLEVAP